LIEVDITPFEKLKNNKQFIVHEQYPIEIIDIRRQLVPIMKDARGKGHEAVLKEDRLYIDKRRYPRVTGGCTFIGTAAGGGGGGGGG
jgi:hypothetical protein